MNSSKSGSKKTTTALLLMIPSMIAATFVSGAALLDMSAAYAQDENACKPKSNPQAINPTCPDENAVIQGPPITDEKAKAFNDESEPNACDNTGTNPNTPPPCLSGSRRR
jgi:hypothetical protein